MSAEIEDADPSNPGGALRFAVLAAMLVVVVVVVIRVWVVPTAPEAGTSTARGAGPTPPVAGATTVPPAPAWRLGATDDEVAETEDLIARTRAALADLSTVEQAEAQGFIWVNSDHMVNPARYFDDRQLDPNVIESLVIGTRDGLPYVRGAMYELDLNQTARDIPALGGPLMVWHGHGQHCFAGATSATPALAGTCAASTDSLDDPPMVHIYLEPQSDDGRVRTAAACGTFMFTDLPMDRTVPGCGPADGHHDMNGMDGMDGMSHG